LEEKVEEKDPFHDKYCFAIWLLLTMKGEMRFNRLADGLDKDLHITLAKPSVLVHLKHLRDEGLVEREVVDAQNVVYRVSGGIERHRDYAANAVKMIQGLEEEKKYLLSLPVAEQVKEVLHFFVLRTLDALKRDIILESRPNFENAYEHWKTEVSYFRYHERMLIEKSKENAEYREKVLEEVDRLTKELVPTRETPVISENEELRRPVWEGSAKSEIETALYEKYGKHQ
jgi:hypothetical protein